MSLATVSYLHDSSANGGKWEICFLESSEIFARKIQISRMCVFQSSKGDVIRYVCLPVWNLKLKALGDEIVDYRLEKIIIKGTYLFKREKQ